MKRDSFIFYRSFFEATKPLDVEQKAELFDVICEFALNQTETNHSPIVGAMFGLIKPQLEANYKRYMNGMKGGRKPKKETKPEPNPNQNETKPEPNGNVNVNKNENENENVIQLETYPFLDFWDLYDKKTGKPKAERKWKSLSNTKKSAIMFSLPKYIESTPDKTYRKNPMTYLNGEHWTDEIIIKQRTNDRDKQITENRNEIAKVLGQAVGAKNREQE